MQTFLTKSIYSRSRMYTSRFERNTYRTGRLVGNQHQFCSRRIDFTPTNYFLTRTSKLAIWCLSVSSPRSVFHPLSQNETKYGNILDEGRLCESWDFANHDASWFPTGREAWNLGVATATGQQIGQLNVHVFQFFLFIYFIFSLCNSLFFLWCSRHFLGGLFVIGLLTLAEDEDMYKFLKSFSKFETLLY